jgi:hypothetical protein
MNAFQYGVLVFLAVLATATARGVVGGSIRKRVAAFWMLIWLSAAGALIWPNATRVVARALGIGRGTDLVLYVSVFTMLAGFFYTYTRFRRMDRMLTVLVRELALEQARKPQAQGAQAQEAQAQDTQVPAAHATGGSSSPQ